MWTPEMTNFLIKNYPVHSNEEVSQMLFEEFGQQFRSHTIAVKASRLGLHKSEYHISKMSKQHQVMDCGKVTKWNKGYSYIRTETGWIQYSRFVLEQATGRKIPKGYAIVFADGDNQNFEPHNLVAVPISWQSIIANNNWIDELLETGLMWLRLHDLCNGLNRKCIRIEKDDAS